MLKKKVGKTTRRTLIFSIVGLIFLILYWFSLPSPIFKTAHSTVVFDSNHNLLGAITASDQQWRFPEIDSIPSKFKTCIINFEDRYFYYHFGINFIAVLRALKQNIFAQKIVSGASTLTMQVIRLSQKNKPRTIYQKLIEMYLSTRLELTYSKDKILRLYATHAPFGSNIVGLETAAWRYFGTSPHHLSWAESAMLAVLPNQPGLIYPGKNVDALFQKRNRLLKKLFKRGIINQETYELSILETIPEHPNRLPNLASHLLFDLIKKGKRGKRINTSLKSHIQQNVRKNLEKYHNLLKFNDIQNACALVIDNHSGQVLAYVGNVGTKNENSSQVDIIQAKRSTGSLLKPFLFALALDKGLITPKTLLPDYPTFFDDFVPKNFSKNYYGAVAADQALIESLNIPFVHLLTRYNYHKFHHKLNVLGFKEDLNPNPDYYGLTLILGGLETSLWKLVNAYYNFYQTSIGKKNRTEINYFQTKTTQTKRLNYPISLSAAWLTTQTLFEVNRPNTDVAWQYFESSKKIAWKTGTSIGFRDAWAIGYSNDYLVGVWVGNADGEGRAGLIGGLTAGPILFDIFKQLDPNTLEHTDFKTPDDITISSLKICKESGLKPNSLCPNSQEINVPKGSLNLETCSYHKKIFLNRKGEQVNNTCSPILDMTAKSWFILPPVMAYYFKKQNPNYEVLPDYAQDCQPNTSNAQMQFIYPYRNTKLFIPKYLDGEYGKIIFELAHQNPAKKVYWHIDNQYIGQTEQDHQIETFLSKGKYTLSVVDEDGYTLRKRIEILSGK